jgi:hypothetical protein
MIQIKLVDRTGGPAATSGPAQLALTNHDKGGSDVMAEPSVLLLTPSVKPPSSKKLVHAMVEWVGNLAR